MTFPPADASPVPTIVLLLGGLASASTYSCWSAGTPGGTRGGLWAVLAGFAVLWVLGIAMARGEVRGSTWLGPALEARGAGAGP